PKSSATSLLWQKAKSEKRVLFQPHAIGVIPARHVRKNDRVAFFETRINLNEVDRGASCLHLDARCALAVGLQLKHRDSAGFLAEGWATDVQHVLQSLQVDGPINT